MWGYFKLILIIHQQDAITGDEMFSDAFKMEETENGVVFEVDCAMVQHRKGVDVNTGANASTEEAAEELEDGVETVNNIVHSFKLQSTAFDKKSFMTYLKGEKWSSGIVLLPDSY